MPISIVPADVAAALVRPLTSIEDQFVPTLCLYAVSKLKAAMPAVETRVAAYEADSTNPAGIDPDVVTAVLAGVVKRAIVNPDGAWSVSEATGPYSKSTTFSGDRSGQAGVGAPGVLAILPSDLAELQSTPGVAAATIYARPAHLSERCTW